MKSRRIPVLIASYDRTSGVVSWAYRLRQALANHPRYKVLLVACWEISWKNRHKFDHYVPQLEQIEALLRRYAPAILIPNFFWPLLPLSARLVEEGVEVRSLGICHSDSEAEYYAPLSQHESLISHFVTVSPTCEQKLVERIPWRASDVTMLPYGVPIMQPFRRRYQNNPMRLIYAGRLVQPQKRIFDFPALMDRLLERGVKFQFNIAGDGHDAGRLRRLLAPYVDSGIVRFLGKVPEHKMVKLWQKHDVFIQVSDYEGVSVSMLEAMGQGVVPAVTLASSGVEGVIRPGRNGFVAPIGNMTLLADLIAQLAYQPGVLEAMGYEAYQTALNYSLSSHAEKFVQVLDRVYTAPLHRQKDSLSGLGELSR